MTISERVLIDAIQSTLFLLPAVPGLAQDLGVPGIRGRVTKLDSALANLCGDARLGDREVDGLGEQELLDLFRSLVLLRTYDERSVVYHRQGRIGTYAIFWNHEAMQAGAVHALEDDDWIFPSYRESAIGLLRGMPPATVLQFGQLQDMSRAARASTTRLR